jgi:hypothetical protein
MRNHWKKVLVAFCLVLTGTVANISTNKDWCFPENDLNIPVSTNKSRTLTMDEVTFNHVIDVVEDIYKPIVKDLGGELEIVRKWEDGTVNAYAQRVGKVYKVNMFGGLARHETVTKEGFALVVCHEIGHHLGGFPKKKSWFGTAWASNEGQADYWGTNKCMKKVLEVLVEDTRLEEEEYDDYEYALEACEEAFESQHDQYICARNSMAGKSLAELFRALRKLPKELHFKDRDKKIVTATNDNHPAPQCRMDTYFSGSLCDKGSDEVISDTDEALGFCYEEGKYVRKERPSCWFKEKK